MSGLADGQAVILTEVDGFHMLELGETSMPERGVDIGGELRANVTWYPGQSMASTQVMGTSEDEITLTGWFRDSWLALDGGAAAAFLDLRQMWLRGSLVELEWGSLLVRRGYIKRVVGKVIREGDIRYTVTFLVSETDEATVIATASQNAAYPSAFELADLLDILSDVADAALLAATISNAVLAVAT